MSDNQDSPYFKLAPGAVKRYGVNLERLLADEPGVTISSASAVITINGSVDAGITAASNVSSGQRTSFLFSGVTIGELGTQWTVDIAMVLSNGETDVRTIYITGERVS